jgi:hypothetical protein
MKTKKFIESTQGKSVDEIRDLLNGVVDLGERFNLSLKVLSNENLLDFLNTQASDVANQFSYDMGLLESAIHDALDEVSEESRNELGYHNVSDVTQDIHVKPSYDWVG